MVVTTLQYARDFPIVQWRYRDGECDLLGDVKWKRWVQDRIPVEVKSEEVRLFTEGIVFPGFRSMYAQVEQSESALSRNPPPAAMIRGRI